MPATTPSQLVDAFLEAVQRSGGSAVYLSDHVRTHPREFAVQYLDQSFRVSLYIWTLTHGGRATAVLDLVDRGRQWSRPAIPEGSVEILRSAQDDRRGAFNHRGHRCNLPGEYRIQMTSVASPLATDPSAHTVLMGYEPDLGVFGGFDLERHWVFTQGSPSVQIDLSALHDALQNGLSFTLKDNGEVGVGVRPDQLLDYVLNASELHGHGARLVPLLQRAAASEDVQEEIESVPSARKRILAEVSRLSRASNFRKKVLDAYGHRCAVTRMQLRLVDAAHILPVAVEGSTDETANGIPLSPTMHRAFDNGLIFLDRDRVMRLNNIKAESLRREDRADGLTQVEAFLNRTVHLPADRGLWPRPDIIARANAIRRIPGFGR